MDEDVTKDNSGATHIGKFLHIFEHVSFQILNHPGTQNY